MKRHLRYIRAGLHDHPGTPVSDYQDGTHNPLFEDEDAAGLQAKLDEWTKTLEDAGIDPCELLLYVRQ